MNPGDGDAVPVEWQERIRRQRFGDEVPEVWIETLRAERAAAVGPAAAAAGLPPPVRTATQLSRRIALEAEEDADGRAREALRVCTRSRKPARTATPMQDAET